MYQAGEFIVYGTNSVCRVESIGKPPFETEEDKLYYTLVPVTGTETIYIPTDSPVFTRPVISREKAEELINSIPDIEEDHFVCHSVRMANEHYQAALQSHDCEELVQLIKTVYAKSRRHGRRVSQVDQRYRKRAKELLAEMEAQTAISAPKQTAQTGQISFAAMQQERAIATLQKTHLAELSDAECRELLADLTSMLS